MTLNDKKSKQAEHPDEQQNLIRHENSSGLKKGEEDRNHLGQGPWGPAPQEEHFGHFTFKSINLVHFEGNRGELQVYKNVY